MRAVVLVPVLALACLAVAGTVSAQFPGPPELPEERDACRIEQDDASSGGDASDDLLHVRDATVPLFVPEAGRHAPTRYQGMLVPYAEAEGLDGVDAYRLDVAPDLLDGSRGPWWLLVGVERETREPIDVRAFTWLDGVAFRDLDGTTIDVVPEVDPAKPAVGPFPRMGFVANITEPIPGIVLRFETVAERLEPSPCGTAVRAPSVGGDPLPVGEYRFVLSTCIATGPDRTCQNGIPGPGVLALGAVALVSAALLRRASAAGDR